MKRATRTRPKCVCGCGKYTTWNRHNKCYYSYVVGHNQKGKKGEESNGYKNGNWCELKQWASNVKERDKYRCQKCKKKFKKGDKGVHAHHTKSKEEYPELIYDEDNGETLCNSCHAFVHSEGESNPFYGKHHTKESNEKNRKWHTGKRHSKETRKKMSKSKLGNTNACGNKNACKKF